jgi:uncharacterized membrane protein HdeD (DUF308 family)
MDDVSEPHAEPRRSALDRWHLRDMSPARRLLVVRGALAIAFGLLALPWPGATLLFLAVLFVTWTLLIGVVCIGGALRNRATLPGWQLSFALGLVSLVAAVAALFYPGLNLLALVFVMGAYALIAGALDVVLAVRGASRQRWLLGSAGIASLAFGALAFLFPAMDAFTLVWLVALYAVVHGALLLAQAFRTSGLAGWPGARPSHRPSG